MKPIIVLSLVFLFFACQQKKPLVQKPIVIDSVTYNNYGESIDTDNVWTIESFNQRLGALSINDTLVVKLEADILEVCSKKGCWMTLDTNGDKPLMVRFKDYGFFMPLEAKGSVIVRGKAYVTETSADDLQHYAEDAGKSQEEIAAITSPKLTYNLEADGVLLAQ
jgi:hypothetical protein